MKNATVRRSGSTNVRLNRQSATGNWQCFCPEINAEQLETKNSKPETGNWKSVFTLRTKLTRVVLYALVAMAVLYLGDDLSLRFRILNREPLGFVTVYRYYALHKTKQKTNYMFAEPEAQACVRSLFPHLGLPPCWYLARHTEQRIDYE
jgi:hypothetical protein